MCVYMHVCMYACMDVRICMYVCMCVCVGARARVWTFKLMSDLTRSSMAQAEFLHFNKFVSSLIQFKATYRLLK